MEPKRKLEITPIDIAILQSMFNQDVHGEDEEYQEYQQRCLQLARERDHWKQAAKRYERRGDVLVVTCWFLIGMAAVLGWVLSR